MRLSLTLRKEDILRGRLDELHRYLREVAASATAEEIHIDISSIGGGQQSIWMTVDELARCYEVPKRTVRHWCETGRIIACKIGREWRIRKDQFRCDLDALERFRTGLRDLNKDFQEPPPDDFE